MRTHICTHTCSYTAAPLHSTCVRWTLSFPPLVLKVSGQTRSLLRTEGPQSSEGRRCGLQTRKTTGGAGSKGANQEGLGKLGSWGIFRVQSGRKE